MPLGGHWKDSAGGESLEAKQTRARFAAIDFEKELGRRQTFAQQLTAFLENCFEIYELYQYGRFVGYLIKDDSGWGCFQYDSTSTTLYVQRPSPKYYVPDAGLEVIQSWCYKRQQFDVNPQGQGLEWKRTK